MKIHRRLGNRRGAEAVEFALISPVLFILLIGMMDFAWFFCHQLLMDQCTERSAHSAAIQLVNDDDANAATTWAVTGMDCWDDFGLNSGGEPTFSLEVNQTNGVFLAHVTGEFQYQSLLGLSGARGNAETGAGGVSLSPLPTNISAISVKYTATQDFSSTTIAN
jgi:hypothetical protein